MLPLSSAAFIGATLRSYVFPVSFLSYAAIFDFSNCRDVGVAVALSCFAFDLIRYDMCCSELLCSLPLCGCFAMICFTV